MTKKKNTISTSTEEETLETCEICGKVIDDVYNWMLECYPIPTPEPPRYADEVLALCQTCYETAERKCHADEERHQLKCRSIDDPWSPS